MDTNEKLFMYSNQVTVTVGQGDSVMTFKWNVPSYDENNNVIGAHTIKEVSITVTTKMLIENAKQTLELVDQISQISGENVENNETNNKE